MINKDQKYQLHKNKNIVEKRALIITEKKNSTIIMMLIAFCLPVLLYLQTISFEFVKLDDDRIISDNINFLSNFGNSYKAFLTDQFIVKSSNLYRPLGTFSYMVDLLVSGGNHTWMFHLSNILLLGLVSCLLFLLLKKFFIAPKLALFSALIYCVHPLFVSTIASMANRTELLLQFFSLLSFIFLIEQLRRGKTIYLFLHWIAFTFALFCKETAAFLPFIYIIYFFTFFYKKHLDKKYFFNIVLYGVSGIFWFWLRAKAIENIYIKDEEFGLLPFLSNLRIISESLTKFFIPSEIDPIPAFSILKTITGMAIIILIIVMVIKNRERTIKEKVFCLSWYVILLLPTMFFRSPLYDYLDHRFFLPLIGILLFLLFIFPRNWIVKGNIKMTWLIIFVLLILCSFTFIKSRSYSNPVTFYDSANSNNPNSPIAHYNRGQIYADSMQFDKAILDYSKATELYPKYIEAYNNRGLIYSSLKQFDRALADYNKVIDLNPKYSEAYNNRGNTYMGLLKYDIALADFNKSIEFNPKYSNAYYNRGRLKYNMNKVNEAISDFKTAISLNNNFIEAYKNIGVVYYNLKNYGEAINNFSKAILITGTDSQLYRLRGLSYLNINRIDLACKDWLKAKESGRNDVEEYITKYCK